MLKLHYLWLMSFISLCNSASADKIGARLAIIIDDIGYNQSQSERAARLDGAFTLSILPFTPHGLSSAKLAHDHGKELMLHLPMSTVNNLPLGKGGLISGMEKSAFLNTFQQDIGNIPNIRGVNNHMGSRLTQESEPMQWLMEALHPSGLYFVDSRTSAKTKAFDIANEYRVPSLKRDVFLDDVNERGAIEVQLNRAIQFAKLRGAAVAIGHPYPATLGVLERIDAVLKQQNVTLVHASQLLGKLVELPKLAEKEASGILNEPASCPVPIVKDLFNWHTNVEKSDKASMIFNLGFGY
ncbi:MAG: divergent polysaccharide deacetylase family protein [Gammaproteobacteria bacterium]|nr:MAG: divergent polysaccharide deacetylase family protein [Gammaproteobacteria bacterium]